MKELQVVETDLKIVVSESIGEVSASILEPPSMKAMMLLAHGAGAGMAHIFMVKLAHALAKLSIGTIRYNFPYTEQGKKRPDTPAVAHKTIEQVILYTADAYKSSPLFVSGKSFGGRMTSQLLAKKSFDKVQGIVFYGFPLHPAGDPSIERAEHLQNIHLPMLFLQGSRDALAEWDLISNVCATLPTAKLVRFEGADHSFKAGKKDVVPELAEATDAWLQTF
ncbi:MAG TPA: alpha/beta family hydrolase [Ohtaekwangia sp.]|uniref:alpha/beta hydrolase family protein n=1 Tax=Ohtaekwangia sp. TaxID=2066019 RepID=UPI002F94B211